ncbi:MAG: hypothetical protein A3G45_01040 [Candidatus Staskawiczbacteria bacterium RIFCSPLOWO2_12_FULL_37_15]|uniref:Uncharacterized protein n=1 Tax=Candidatus Staskawiczbacteria bacterium RIFCSPLOWO2_12_FULL_37_15 TaxID=1802218 RepID=A0A1G2ILV0_9BACT|nr:MAG: hypothetical protein A3G45_01040 [Candidatus Staskawiczbacteria bacterium RIFCSPLOWO2_12_FULL_37_15]
MIISKKSIYLFFILLLCSSLAVNGWLMYLIYQTANVFESQKINSNVLSFTDMFVKKVLMAKGEIDFDTRLELETTVRSLNDQQIFDQWQAFTKAETKEESSDNAKRLLNLLVKKLKEQN